MADWHRATLEKTVQTLGTDADRGLDDDQARRLLQEHGPNELVERAARSPWRMLLEQFTETMVVILLIAALVSGLLGKLTETIAILAIVLMFAILGFVQEYRAERAMAALKKMAVPTVRVRRAGQVRELPARELVRGDVLLLEAGNLVPEFTVGVCSFAVRNRAVVNQGGLVCTSVFHVCIEGVVTGIEFTAGEPPVVRSVAVVEYFVPFFGPVHVFGSVAPELFRVVQ